VLELLASLHELPEAARDGIRDQGGGYLNHAMLWAMIAEEGGGQPAEELAQAVQTSFGSFDDLKRQMSEAAAAVFGSGWAWLTVDATGKLAVEKSANQDSPLTEGRRPLLGIDVWEHAYYLRYQNRRAEYVERIWDVVNWYQILINYRASTA
jgi:Fe-Mn family superoxide dismutase